MRIKFLLLFYTSLMIYSVYSRKILKKYEKITINCASDNTFAFDSEGFSEGEDMYFKATYEISGVYDSIEVAYKYSNIPSLAIYTTDSRKYNEKRSLMFKTRKYYYYTFPKKSQKYLLVRFATTVGDMEIENTESDESKKDQIYIIVIIVVVIIVVIAIIIVAIVCIRKCRLARAKLLNAQYTTPAIVVPGAVQPVAVTVQNAPPYVPTYQNGVVPTNAPITNDVLGLNQNPAVQMQNPDNMIPPSTDNFGAKY